jgi:hypothetical protein
MKIMHLSAGSPFLLLLVLLSCTSERPNSRQEDLALPHLRTVAASQCDPNLLPLVLEVPRRGGFVLNTAPFDSAGLSTWFREKLPGHVAQGRLVFVQLDSSRVDELRWLVPAIEAAGGGAYVPDATCAWSIRAPAV